MSAMHRLRFARRFDDTGRPAYFLRAWRGVLFLSLAAATLFALRWVEH